MNSRQIGNFGTQSRCGQGGERLSLWETARQLPLATVKLLRYQRVTALLLSLVLSLSCIAVWAVNAAPAAANDYNKEILLGADFSGRDLTDSSFTKANLRNTNFSHANLQGVSFFGANLEMANLEGADLRNATLDTARLSDANLTNAVLEGAFAFNTKFDRAIIDGADFTDVEFRLDAQALLCKAAKGKNPVTGRDTRETLNCR